MDYSTRRDRNVLAILTIVIALAAGFALPSREDTLPYSDGVLVGNALYLAGRIGIDPETGKPQEDAEKEIKFLLDGMKTTLAAANMTTDDLVSVQTFCPDLTLYDKFNEIYRTCFTKDFPARALHRFRAALERGHFEMQGIEVRRYGFPCELMMNGPASRTAASNPFPLRSFTSQLR